MKAIQTRYLPATAKLPARMKAWAEQVKPLVLSRHSRAPNLADADGDALHLLAAQALCVRMGWSTDLVGGGLPNGDYAFCFRGQP